MDTKFTLDECSFLIQQPTFSSSRMTLFSIKATPKEPNYQIPIDKHISLDIRCNDFSGLPGTYKSLLQMGLPYEIPNSCHNIF